MSYTCPSCAFGTMKPRRVTYMRRWESHMVTIPNFKGWSCDSCGYTRYDADALARLDMVLGPDDESLRPGNQRRQRPIHGPGERGPHRWSM